MFAGGGSAAGINALSPVTAQVLAATAKQQPQRKSRLQHVTAAATDASPSSLHQSTPGTVAAAVAAPEFEGHRQTPQGIRSAMRGRAHTPQTAHGLAQMTPKTGSVQRQAVSKRRLVTSTET